MLDTTKTLVEMLGLYGALWLANTLIATHNSLNKGFKFSWKYLVEGTTKAAIGAVALLVGSGALYAIPHIFANAGIVVSPEVAAALSILGIIGVVGAGVVTYAQKFVKNVQDLFSSASGVRLEVKPDAKDPNKGTIILDVKDLPASKFRPDVANEPKDEKGV